MDTPPIRYAMTPDGVSIGYWSLGEGFPLLMAQIPNSHAELEWRIPEARMLFEAYSGVWQVVRLDCRGTGLSDRDGVALSLEAFGSDILAVADRLGLERFHLTGVDIACPVVLSLAARHPERIASLVVENGAARGADLVPPEFRALLSLEESAWEFVSEAMVARIAGFDDRALAAPMAASLRAAVTLTGLRAIVEEAVTWDVTPLLPEIETPVLIMHNRGGLVSDLHSRRLASLLPSATLAITDSHSPADQDPLTPFLVQHTPGLTGRAPTFGQGEAPAFRTILFTDLESHTAMMSRLGDARGREVLREHERVTRLALREHGGTEIKAMGDGFMASFGSAQRALQCAIAIQSAFAAPVAGEPIRVRIGINAGEPIAEDDDLFGASVIAAARIAAKAEGGQVLVANVVRELVAGKGFLFADTGLFELKGMEDPVRLWELRT